jgi:hypothetical protein
VGKSSLLNTTLRRRILPSRDGECTGRILKITYAPKDQQYVREVALTQSVVEQPPRSKEISPDLSDRDLQRYAGNRLRPISHIKLVNASFKG